MTTYERPDLTQLKGKTIILTGCATGIGRATAKLAYREYFFRLTLSGVLINGESPQKMVQICHLQTGMRQTSRRSSKS